MKYQHQTWTKPIVVISLHVVPPLLAAWSSHFWDHGHEFLALPMAITAGAMALAALARDLWLDEIVEALSPTHIYHGSTAIEPPRPLPSFDDQPSRVRIKPLVDSVAPPDGDTENTWPEVG